MSNIEKNIKYVDLEGLKIFAKKLKEWLQTYIANSNTFASLKAEIKNAKDRITQLENSNTSLYTIVNSLDTIANPNENTIYLLITGISENKNLFDEYIYVNNKWEKIGSMNSNPNSDFSGILSRLDEIEQKLNDITV